MALNGLFCADVQSLSVPWSCVLVMGMEMVSVKKWMKSTV